MAAAVVDRATVTHTWVPHMQPGMRSVTSLALHRQRPGVAFTEPTPLTPYGFSHTVKPLFHHVQQIPTCLPSHRPVASQLSAGLAALAVRAGAWDPSSLVPQLLSLLAPGVAAALVAELQMAAAVAAAAGVEAALGPAALGRRAGQGPLAAAANAEASAMFALLQVRRDVHGGDSAGQQCKPPHSAYELCTRAQGP